MSRVAKLEVEFVAPAGIIPATRRRGGVSASKTFVRTQRHLTKRHTQRNYDCWQLDLEKTVLVSVSGPDAKTDSKPTNVNPGR